jgi:hypothetical protein
MRLVKKILNLTPFIGLFCFIAPLKAQINSPFSRYGVGNEVYNSQNAANQGMGGLTAAYTLKDVERVSNGEFTVQALGSYERNHRTISLKRLLRLCDVYKVSIDTVIKHSMYADQMHAMRKEYLELRTTA